MEIRSAPLLHPLLPDPTGRATPSARAPLERPGEVAPAGRTELAERVYQGDLVEEEAGADYGELIRRARFLGAGSQGFEAPADAPFRARQAIVAYASNVAPPEVELMPRVDDFV